MGKILGMPGVALGSALGVVLGRTLRRRDLGRRALGEALREALQWEAGKCKPVSVYRFVDLPINQGELPAYPVPVVLAHDRTWSARQFARGPSPPPIKTQGD